MRMHTHITSYGLWLRVCCARLTMLSVMSLDDKIFEFESAVTFRLLLAVLPTWVMLTLQVLLIICVSWKILKYITEKCREEDEGAKRYKNVDKKKPLSSDFS